MGDTGTWGGRKLGVGPGVPEAFVGKVEYLQGPAEGGAGSEKERGQEA